ncbi:hypothetical protein KP509_24G069200 [Ceratopteris richardii]|uniref:Uncharacterized protein n=1 Tax=Ceratopteris richardii TaxID=49495 RepID=A0A8T2RVT1_CERRI|nr:hypothetical protein KP509_1Z199300 [Ceratopteris richardii]KAH7300576.1 hypothetical protein KP509_24G069200 [Ceratopteris richardii]
MKILNCNYGSSLYQSSQHNLCDSDRKGSVEDATQGVPDNEDGHAKVTNATNNVLSCLAFYRDKDGGVGQLEDHTDNGPICCHQLLLSTESTCTSLHQQENVSKSPIHLYEDIIVREPF